MATTSELQTIEGHPCLEFASSDIGDSTVGNKVFTTHDGDVYIKSDYFGRFQRHNPNWIWVDSDDSTTNNSDTLFWPVRVDTNFCNRLTTEGKTNCLNAAVSTISKELCLEVGELVLSRNTYNVNFCLMDARIYNQRVIVMTTVQSVNNFYFYFWKLLLIYFILFYQSYIFGKCPIENYFLFDYILLYSISVIFLGRVLLGLCQSSLIPFISRITFHFVSYSNDKQIPIGTVLVAYKSRSPLIL